MSADTSQALDDASRALDEAVTAEELEETLRCEEIAAELSRARRAGLDPRWARRALCASRDYPYDMYPEPGNHRGMAIALGACARCPVRMDCLSEALAAEGDTPEKTRGGISGGTTPRERWVLAGRPKRVAADPPSCGSAGAFERHWRAGETCGKCEAWRAAEDERVAARLLGGGGSSALLVATPTAPECGTVDGFVHHRRARTAACPKCKAAAKAAGVTWSTCTLPPSGDS